MWASDRREIATTTEQGGKGGGVESTTYTYEVDLLYLLTDNTISGVLRVWNNGKLIFTNLDGADFDSVEASNESELWTRFTVYTGDVAQLPDPTYEATGDDGMAHHTARANRVAAIIWSVRRQRRCG